MATIWLRFFGGRGVFAKRLRKLATIHLFDFSESLLRLVKVKEKWLRFFRGGGFQSFWLRYGYDTVGQGGLQFFLATQFLDSPLCNINKIIYQKLTNCSRGGNRKKKNLTPRRLFLRNPCRIVICKYLKIKGQIIRYQCGLCPHTLYIYILVYLP